MSIVWENAADRTVVDVRLGGPGNSWKVLDIDASLDAPSGGGRAVESRWGRGEMGGLAPRGSFYTGNPDRWTFNLMMRLRAQNFLTRLECPFDVRVRERCGRPDDIVSYSEPGIIGYQDTINTSTSYSDPLATVDGTSADMMKQFAGSALFEELYTQLAHDDISKTWSDADLNAIAPVGVKRCAGDCGEALTGEEQWVVVSDRDSTPGYSGNPTARLYYTLDSGANWSSVPIDPFTAADATDVVVAGGTIIAFSPGKAPAYARWQDILDGVTAPNLWATSTGFSAISSPDFPKDAYAVNSSVIIAVGNSGRVWRSTNGGISFTVIDNQATTTQNLNSIAMYSETLGYIAGDAGTFLRYNNGVISLVVVTDGTNTLSANVNKVLSQPGFANRAYLLTAGGEVWRSNDANSTTPIFENMAFTQTGNGQIISGAFAGYRGDMLYLIQNNVDGESRILRDHSGGALGADVEVIGSFTSPSNFGLNDIGMANVNFGLTVGNIHENYGFFGQLRSAQIPSVS